MAQAMTIVRISLVATVAALLSLRAGDAPAAELVMFDSPVCEWCEVWEEEVGIVYRAPRKMPLRDQGGIAAVLRPHDFRPSLFVERLI